MDRDDSQAEDGLGAMHHAGPEELQTMVDSLEAAGAARYRRLQDYTGLLAEAMRHDAAMNRLERALELTAAH